MGLDTSHDCWHGSYGGFRQFREAVGKAAGLPYRVVGPGSWESGKTTLDIDWDLYDAENFQGNWQEPPAWQQRGDIYGCPKRDDVLYLLAHSDCDGWLRLNYLPQLKARLEELEYEYECQTDGDDYLQGRLRQFINGLESAIDASEDVEFS